MLANLVFFPASTVSRWTVTDPDLLFQQFDVDYENGLAMLAERQGDDDAIDALMFAEEARQNSGADQYVPEWIQPFVAVVANLAQESLIRQAAASGGLASVIPSAIAPALVQGGSDGLRGGVFRSQGRLGAWLPERDGVAD